MLALESRPCSRGGFPPRGLSGSQREARGASHRLCRHLPTGAVRSSEAAPSFQLRNGGRGAGITLAVRQERWEDSPPPSQWL